VVHTIRHKGNNSWLRIADDGSGMNGRTITEAMRYGADARSYRILTDQVAGVEPPVRGENILNSYVAHLKQIQNPQTSIEDEALHLPWIFHQAGDIHQSLHVVSRFSKALPHGDRGGNEVHVPNPRVGGRSNNLHAFWDELLGTNKEPAAIEKLGEELIQEYPSAALADETTKTNIKDWVEESVQICLKTVYRNLDPEIANFVDLPVGYEVDAKRAARRWAVVAA
jgi:hypothetical protein